MINSNNFSKEMRFFQAFQDASPFADDELAWIEVSRHAEALDSELNWILWYCILARKRGEAALVTTKCMSWLHRFPDSVSLVHEVAWAWLECEEAFRAERLIRAALKVHGDELMLWCDLAAIHLHNNHLDAAKECCDYVLARDASFTEALRLKARVALKCGDNQAAQRAVDESLIRDPKNMDGLIMHGILMDAKARQGNMNEVKQSSRMIIRFLYVFDWIGRLCNRRPAIALWGLIVFILWACNLTSARNAWQDWIFAPQLLIGIILAGWALRMTAAFFIHQMQVAIEHRPIWRTDWIWTVAPILLWLALTMVHLLVNSSYLSFEVDLFRTLAYCSIVPLYLMKSVLGHFSPTFQQWNGLWLMAVVSCFVIGLLTGQRFWFGIAYLVTACSAIYYLLGNPPQKDTDRTQ
jgi:tetratricopeptide (TPR) repeat protein